MLRRTDAIGMLGLVMLLVGVALFLTASAVHMTWLYWVGGPVLWFFGFALLVGWMVVRWGHPERKDGSSKSSPK